MGKITKSCEVCGIAVSRYPYEFGERCYCSPQCYAIGNTMTNNKNWKGGRIKTKAGYILIHQPNHPNADKNGYVFEHRLVLEKKLGRLLTKNETSHHINHIRDDNREDNLMLLNRGSHLSSHRLDGSISDDKRKPKNGRWASEYNQCIRCGRSDRGYGGNGLCHNCYNHEWKERRKIDGHI